LSNSTEIFTANASRNGDVQTLQMLWKIVQGIRPRGAFIFGNLVKFQ